MSRALGDEPLHSILSSLGSPNELDGVFQAGRLKSNGSTSRKTDDQSTRMQAVRMYSQRIPFVSDVQLTFQLSLP